VARAILHFAELEGADQLVLGATRRSRMQELAHGSLVQAIVRAHTTLEVHIVPAGHAVAGQRGVRDRDEPPARAPLRMEDRRPRRFPQWRRRRSELPASRRAVAYVLALAAPALVAGVLVPFRASVGLPGTLLFLLLAVILAAGAGGLGPAGVATLAGILLADYYLTHPLHSFRLDRPNEIIALVAFAVVASVVSVLVNVLINAGVLGARRLAVADGLARLAADCLVAGGSAVPQKTLEALRRTLELDGVAVLRASGTDWRLEAAAGEHVPLRPDEADSFVEVGAGRVLVLGGSRSVAEEADLVKAFLSEIQLEQERIQLERLRRLAGPEPASGQDASAPHTRPASADDRDELGRG